MSTNTKPFIQYHNKKNSTVSTLNVQDTTTDSNYNLPTKSGTLVTEEDVHKFASMVEIPVLTVQENEGYVRGTPYQKGMFYLEDMVKSVWEFSTAENFSSTLHTEELTTGDMTSLFFPKYVVENATNTVYLRAKYVSRTMQSDWSEPVAITLETIRVLGNNIFLIGKPTFNIDLASGTMTASEFTPRNNYAGTFGYMEVQFSTEDVVDTPKFISNTQTVRFNGYNANLPESYLEGNKDIWVRARFASTIDTVTEYSPYSEPFKIEGSNLSSYRDAWKKILTPTLSIDKAAGTFNATPYEVRGEFSEPLKEVVWEFYRDENYNTLLEKINNTSTTIAIPDKLLQAGEALYVRVKYKSNTEESLYSNTLNIPAQEVQQLIVSLKKIKTPTLDFNSQSGEFSTSSYAVREFTEPLKEVVWEFSTDTNFTTTIKVVKTKAIKLYIPDDIVNKTVTIHVRAKHTSETEESLYSNIKSFTKEELGNLLVTLKGVKQPEITEIVKSSGLIVVSEPRLAENFTEPVSKVMVEYSHTSDFSTVDRKETIALADISDSLIEPGGTYKYTTIVNKDMLQVMQELYIRISYLSEYTDIRISDVHY